MLARAALRNGLAPKRFMLRFAGSSNVGRSPFLPVNPQLYAQRLRTDARQLLYGHTVFPYVVAYMAPGEVRRLENLFLGATPERVSSGSLLRPFTNRFHRLYFCPECALKDFELHGESYWHRAHNLPATQVCVLHGIELRASDTQVNTLSRLLGAPLPHLQRGGQDLLKPHPASQHLARASTRTLELGWELHEQWQHRYRQLAMTRGYLHTNGGVNSEWLASCLRNWYGERYLNALNATVRGSHGSWPALLTRVRSCPEMSPLRHILMEVFLEQHEAATIPPKPSPPGKKPRDLVALDRSFSLAVERMTKSMNLSGQRTTVRLMLKGMELWHIYRHNSAKLPLTSEQLARFRRTEASERKTGGRSQRARRADPPGLGSRVPPRTSE